MFSRGTSSNQSEAFRSCYGELAELRSLVSSKTPFIALTATATSQTKMFIIENLCLYRPYLSISTPEKKNIKFSVIKLKSRNPAEILQTHVDDIRTNMYAAEKVLIFCRIMKDVRLIYNFFDKNFREQFKSYEKRPYAMYHAKTEAIVKDHVSREFSSHMGTVRILIATIAFGMGVDCKNLHKVIHFRPSASLEEVGRAGRDGDDSDGIMLTYPKCLNSKHISKNVKMYVNNDDQCRRRIILKEFDEIAEREREYYLYIVVVIFVKGYVIVVIIYVASQVTSP